TKYPHERMGDRPASSSQTGRTQAERPPPYGLAPRRREITFGRQCDHAAREAPRTRATARSPVAAMLDPVVALSENRSLVDAGKSLADDSHFVDAAAPLCRRGGRVRIEAT